MYCYHSGLRLFDCFHSSRGLAKMILEKFTCHHWPTGTPQYYLAWFPESEPDGVIWGPCATEFIRDDIARRILARNETLREHETFIGIPPLPDARYQNEKGLTNYR